MTDWDERTLNISLDFLGEGDFNAEIIRDPDQIEGDPVNIVNEKMSVKKGDVINANLASGGGHILIITPKNK